MLTPERGEVVDTQVEDGLTSSRLNNQPDRPAVLSTRVTTISVREMAVARTDHRYAIALARPCGALSDRRRVPAWPYRP